MAQGLQFSGAWEWRDYGLGPGLLRLEACDLGILGPGGPSLGKSMWNPWTLLMTTSFDVSFRFMCE